MDTLPIMSNKSTFCYQCENFGKVPIYYRDENRVHKVAFYVCSNCMHFSGFINWTTNRSMPYYNQMSGLIRMRLVKKYFDKPSDQLTRKQKVLLMQNDPYLPCIKCKKYDFKKLHLRNRKKNTYEFIGYVCKNCKVGYLVNSKNLKFRTLSPQGYWKYDGSLPNFHGIPFIEYLGQFATAIGEDEEKPIEEEYIIVKKTDISKLKKAKISFKYNN